MDFIELAIPVLVFLLIFIISTNLEKSDIEKIKVQQKKILVITIGQMLLLPLCALLIIKVMQPNSLVAGGLLLVSLCPGGAVSNIYSFLAKANVALSFSLTVVNGIVSVFVLPLVMLIVFPSLLGLDLSLNIIKQRLQLLLLLLLLIVFGMALRNMKRTLMLNLMPALEKVGVLGLVLLLLAIF